MALYFLDSSALVKRYINEVGSAWILSLLNPASNPEFFVAAVASMLGYRSIVAIGRLMRAISRRLRGRIGNGSSRGKL
jgi:uncharacterized protein